MTFIHSLQRIVCRPVEEKELEDWEVYDEVTKGGKAVQSSSQKSKYRRLEVTLIILLLKSLAPFFITYFPGMMMDKQG